jgi:hypothetical protein
MSGRQRVFAIGIRRGADRRPLAATAHSTPKTIAPRKTNAAPTAIRFRGLMKVIGWPPSASWANINAEAGRSEQKNLCCGANIQGSAKLDLTFINSIKTLTTMFAW